MRLGALGETELDRYYTLYTKVGPYTWDSMAAHLSTSLTGAQLKAMNEYADHVTSVWLKTPIRILKQYLRPEIANTPGLTTDSVSYANPINYTLNLQKLRDLMPELLKPGAPASAVSVPATSRKGFPVGMTVQVMRSMLNYYWQRTHSGQNAPESVLSSGFNYSSLAPAASGSGSSSGVMTAVADQAQKAIDTISNALPSPGATNSLAPVTIDSTATVVPDQKFPTWVWVAGGVGAVLLLMYMVKKGR